MLEESIAKDIDKLLISTEITKQTFYCTVMSKLMTMIVTKNPTDYRWTVNVNSKGVSVLTAEVVISEFTGKAKVKLTSFNSAILL
jgi:hypothetical protein